MRGGREGGRERGRSRHGSGTTVWEDVGTGLQLEACVGQVAPRGAGLGGGGGSGVGQGSPRQAAAGLGGGGDRWGRSRGGTGGGRGDCGVGRGVSGGGHGAGWRRSRSAYDGCASFSATFHILPPPPGGSAEHFLSVEKRRLAVRHGNSEGQGNLQSPAASLFATFLFFLWSKWSLSPSFLLPIHPSLFPSFLLSSLLFLLVGLILSSLVF